MGFSSLVTFFLTLSCIYPGTHFNSLKKKPLGNIVEKGEIAHFEQFHLFPTMFPMQSVSLNPLIATFQLSFAVSLNLGQSQNGVLGNGLSILQTFVYPWLVNYRNIIL